MTVAALYVEAAGSYAGLPDVELWAEDRDARTYPGPFAVVAHPPCSTWSLLAPWVEIYRGGAKRGDDGGCFEAALESVREWGGVLEHPAYSAAWNAYGLNRPVSASAGWINADFEGGWTCHVEQGHYGHPGAKPTWLYAIGEPPALRWGPASGKAVQLLSRKQRNATPDEFRDLLLDMARSIDQ